MEPKRLGAAEDDAGALVFSWWAAGAFITGDVVEMNGGLWFVCTGGLRERRGMGLRPMRPMDLPSGRHRWRNCPAVF